MIPVIIGSTGVGLLLIAFVLNLMRVLSERSIAYLVMNVVGCILAGIYAWIGEQYPFVVLEAAWGLAATIRLIQVIARP